MNNHTHPTIRPFRIALTGGPGGGKTTAADLFRRELGEEVVIVPEAATMLFTGGFPRDFQNPNATMAIQKTIYHVQKNLEDIQTARYPDRYLLCDRGTVDGAAYWPAQNEHGFFDAVSSTLQHELGRYDAVIFFETAAVGGISIEGGNPIRNENLKQAIEINQNLKDLWSQHPHFSFVPHDNSFMKKIVMGMTQIKNVLEHLALKKPAGS